VLAALLLMLQATPEGIAERDARELEETLVAVWNDTEAIYFARESRSAADEITSLTIALGEGGGLSVQGNAPGLHGISLQPTAAGVDLTVSGARAPCRLRMRRVGEAFLADRAEPCPGSVPTFVTSDALALSDGTELRRADPYACWVSRQKEGGGWTWTPDVEVREGEYVQVPDEADVPRPAGIRLRHVRWPYGTNRDSLVLYVHEAEDEPAVSYAWTEPDGERIAVNLRWVQANCTRAE
jgi:hypothetical protein